jgi:excisionase family DNA binding protein
MLRLLHLLRILRLLRALVLHARIDEFGTDSSTKEGSTMGATEALDAVVKPDPDEDEALNELRQKMDEAFEHGYTPCLIGPDGDQTELPHSAFEALRFVIRGMAAGQTMTLIPSGKLLTSRQAADMLQVSRPHLIKLLELREIPFEMVGTHRRVKVSDVLEYRAGRAKGRREQLRELSQYSAEEGGGYR